MTKSPEESKHEWRKAFWIIAACIFATLVASVVGLIIFHGLPGGR